MELTSVARSKRTRMFLTGALLFVRKSTRTWAWLFVVPTLTGTTLGLADTDTDRIGCSALLTGAMPPELADCTSTVVFSSTPPAEARKTRSPVETGAVYL